MLIPYPIALLFCLPPPQQIPPPNHHTTSTLRSFAPDALYASSPFSTKITFHAPFAAEAFYTINTSTPEAEAFYIRNIQKPYHARVIGIITKEYTHASGVPDSKTYERVKRPLKSAEKPWDAKHPRTTIQRDSKTSEMI